MYRFTIDFVGLLNAQNVSLYELARRCEMDHDRVRAIALENPSRYNRNKVALMLKHLGVTPYPPLRLEESDNGLMLTVDWEGLLRLQQADVPMLVKWTKLRHYKIYYMLYRDPEQYDRKTLGAVLNALNVNLYPPFFIENENEPRGPYEPTNHYHRAKPRKPKG